MLEAAREVDRDFFDRKRGNTTPVQRRISKDDLNNRTRCAFAARSGAGGRAVVDPAAPRPTGSGARSRGPAPESRR
eukprot:4726107-Pyramimonas_sp.AAC.1